MPLGRVPPVSYTHLDVYKRQGRQFADEPDRIRKQERQVVEDHLADRGVERGEELVLGKNLALRNKVHQRRFADVGIAHQRHADHRTAVGALDRHLTVDRCV